MIAFVLVYGTTSSLLHGPVRSSEPCTETNCAAPGTTGAGVAPKAASLSAPPPAVSGVPLRIVVYDPALEPLKIVPWDAQTRSGPEAPARDRTPRPEAGSGGRHEE